MAPVRTKKTTATAETTADDALSEQRNVTLQSPTRTPTQSPIKKAMMITESQKQALIDNLQLEGICLSQSDYSSELK